MLGVGTRGQRNPWWIPHLLFGRTPQVERRKVTLLGCVAIAVFYENYPIITLSECHFSPLHFNNHET